MLNRMRADVQWPLRRAAVFMLVVGGLPSLAGGLVAGMCLCDMASGHADPFGSIVGVLATIFLLVPGVIYLVLAVLVWRGRAGTILAATVYTWILVGLFGLLIARDVHWAVLVSGGFGPVHVIYLSIKSVGVLVLLSLLWCLLAAGRYVQAQASHGFELILPNAQPVATGYPPTTPPPARGRVDGSV